MIPSRRPTGLSWTSRLVCSYYRKQEFETANSIHRNGTQAQQTGCIGCAAMVDVNSIVESLKARAKARAADPLRGADAFQLPTAMIEWYNALDQAGAKACVEATWWQDFLKHHCGNGWTRNWPLHGKHPESHEFFVHRESAPLHFVIGRQSPYYIERCFRNDRLRCVWAVYLGPYCSNGDDQLGVGNGGAIAALLDLMTATLANIYWQGNCPTVSLEVKMLKPVQPIPGLFKAEAWIEKEENGKLYTKAEFGNGKDTIFDVCEAVLKVQKKTSRL